MSRLVLFLSVIVLLASCATYDLQVRPTEQVTVSGGVQHRVYLIGDVGGSRAGKTTIPLIQLTEALASDGYSDVKTDVIFLGDNIYPVGLPPVGHPDRSLAEHKLDVQLDAMARFGGNVTFIPGNHDWYEWGRAGLRRQEQYIEERLAKYGKSFLDYWRPSDGCGDIAVHETIGGPTIVSLDSHWFLTDQPSKGDYSNCKVSTREQMVQAYLDTLSQLHGRDVLITMHHPLYTVGKHGGKYESRDYLLPFARFHPMALVPNPAVGAAINYARPHLSPQDSKSAAYQVYRKSLIPPAQNHGAAIFASGHDHSLQYHIVDGVHHIVSGSGSKRDATKADSYTQFTYGNYGFARLDYLVDGSKHLSYYALEGNTFRQVYSTMIP